MPPNPYAHASSIDAFATLEDEVRYSTTPPSSPHRQMTATSPRRNYDDLVAEAPSATMSTLETTSCDGGGGEAKQKSRPSLVQLIDNNDPCGSSLPSPPPPSTGESSGGLVISPTALACLRRTMHCCIPESRLLSVCGRNCDPTLFWRMLPSLLVSKALWMSLATLGLCDLAQIVLVDAAGGNTGDDAPSFLDDPSRPNEQQLTFGLWSYSAAPADHDHSGEDRLQEEMERVTMCRYHGENDLDGGGVFFVDPLFRTARTFAVLAVVIGLCVTGALWWGLARGFASLRWRSRVGAGLALCCFAEGMALLVLQAGVCRGGSDERFEYRDCRISEGGGNVIAACSFWFLTGLAVLRLPPPDDRERVCESDDEGGEEEVGVEVMMTTTQRRRGGVECGNGSGEYGEEEDYDDNECGQSSLGNRVGFWLRRSWASLKGTSVSMSLSSEEVYIPKDLELYTAELHLDGTSSVGSDGGDEEDDGGRVRDVV